MACGRVIARPYIIRDGKRVRTADRKDYAVSPPEETVLDKIKSAGKRVYAVGKISDIFLSLIHILYKSGYFVSPLF